MSWERGASTARPVITEGGWASRVSLPVIGLAVVASGGTALLFLLHARLGAGVLALAGAASLLFGSAVARASGATVELLAELLADGMFDARVLAPVARVTRGTSPRVPALALTAPGAPSVAPHERAGGAVRG